MYVKTDKVKQIYREGEDLVLVVSPDGISAEHEPKEIVKKLYQLGWKPNIEGLFWLLKEFPKDVLPYEDEQRLTETILRYPSLIEELAQHLPPETTERILEKMEEKPKDLGTLELLSSFPKFRVSERAAEILLDCLELAERWKRFPESWEGRKFSRALRLVSRLKKEGKLPPEVDEAYRTALADFKLRNLKRRARTEKGLEEMMALLPFLPPEKRAKAVAILLLGERRWPPGAR